jgi:hypothetical protein
MFHHHLSTTPMVRGTVQIENSILICIGFEKYGAENIHEERAGLH